MALNFLYRQFSYAVLLQMVSGGNENVQSISCSTSI